MVDCDLLFCLSPNPAPSSFTHKNRTLSCGICKRKSTKQNLMLIGFPSDGITLRTSMICENLNYFGISFEASLVNENGMFGPLCLPFSCLSLLFMLFCCYLFFLSLHFFSWLTKEGYSVAGQITHLMPRDFG